MLATALTIYDLCGKHAQKHTFERVSALKGTIYFLAGRRSGRETFLASLALALALVEMHSRSGARLDALFLDEGFGSRDADALTSSLAVLNAETGGNKLVAVISHLDAVAEAVEDVMWVERQSDGSTARWLTAAERDALCVPRIASVAVSSEVAMSVARP